MSCLSPPVICLLLPGLLEVGVAFVGVISGSLLPGVFAFPLSDANDLPYLCLPAELAAFGRLVFVTGVPSLDHLSCCVGRCVVLLHDRNRRTHHILLSDSVHGRYTPSRSCKHLPFQIK